MVHQSKYLLMQKILIIDDEYDICNMVSMILSNYDVHKATCIESAKKILQSKQIDLIILDVWLGANTGLDFLADLRKVSNIPVIIISGHGSIDLAVKAVKLGAEDFLEKPFSGDKLIVLVDRIIQNHIKIQKTKLIPVSEHFFIGSSDKWQQFHKKISKISDQNIIVSGPIGSGKYDTISCILRNFTIVNNIIHLDESEIDKIKTFKRHDIVILSTKNSNVIDNIKAECTILIMTLEKNGIEVPSLLNRDNDALELFEYFLKKIGQRIMVSFTHDIEINDIKQYAWPGNILELKNITYQLAIDSIDQCHISKYAFLEKINAIDIYQYEIKKARHLFEKRYLEVNLKRCNKNIAKMARMINMERSALYRKMKKDFMFCTHQEK